MDPEVPVDQLPVERAARSGTEIRDCELGILFDDGSMRYLFGNATPVRDERGGVRGAIGAFIDITERKRIEALGDALSAIHLIVHSSHDIDHIMQHALRAAAAALGSDSAAVSLREGQHWAVRYVEGFPAGILGSRMVDDEERHAVQALREKTPIAIVDALDDDRVNREHMRKWNIRSVLVVPLVVRDEAIGVAFFNYQKQPRALGRAEVDFGAKLGTTMSLAVDNSRLVHELRESDSRKTQFLAVLSHELRNPLAPIRNSILLLDRASPSSEVALRAREVLRRQTEQLSRLVDDLLDVSRITHGKIELKLNRLDARDVVRRACSDVRGMFERRGIEFLLAEGAEPAWVEADQARLAQMVGNLLNNALKFTPPDGQVEVRVQRRGSMCEVAVRDTGMGIEPADLDRIFHPFVQAERTRLGAQGGLGIGLALVRELAEKHGGAVRAASGGTGQGSEFTLTIPLAAGPVTTPTGAEMDEEACPAARLSILIVEDNEDGGAALADLLALSGHQVRLVTTGRAGLEAVSAHPPDVLLCDVGLPDMSGYEVIRAIRSARTTQVFAIALTGYAQPQDRREALQAGFDAHLPKPPPLEELNTLLEGAARRRSYPTPPVEA